MTLQDVLHTLASIKTLVAGVACVSAFILSSLQQFSETALVGGEGAVLRNLPNHSVDLGQTTVCDLSKHDRELGK